MPFIPHLSLTVAIILAFMCVATLVYFVGHMAGRINVDTVIELVSEEVQSAIVRLTTDKRQADPPPAEFWKDGTPIDNLRRGYLQHWMTKGSPIGRPKHDYLDKAVGAARATIFFPAQRSR